MIFEYGKSNSLASGLEINSIQARARSNELDLDRRQCEMDLDPPVESRKTDAKSFSRLVSLFGLASEGMRL